MTASNRPRSVRRRRFLPYFIVAGLTTLFVLHFFDAHELVWAGSLRAVGLRGKDGPSAEQIAGGQNILLDLEKQYPWREPAVEDSSPYSKGQTKPPGSNYTKCLVISKMKKEDTDWIDEELGDMVGNASLTTAVYTVDDKKAKLHPPKNKGHEVMVYLSYIIDNYEDLADVNVFMHAHRFAYHNSELLDRDAAQIVRSLSSERVTREGYMNLRCHWDPGCPTWLFPENKKMNSHKQEEVLLAKTWPQLFPLDPIPEVLAQPCCAQFAVSRERILQTPKTRYLHLRDWLMRTDLSDFLSGRIFEYVWQFIFSGSAVHCPRMSACSCDGYGLCFGSEGAFEDWMELVLNRNEYEEKLEAWEEEREYGDVQAGKPANGAKFDMDEGENLRMKIADVEMEMAKRKRKAVELGKDPKQRALESGRQWKEGDGY